MEHKEHRLIIVSSKLLLDVCLGVVQNHRLQINIPWGIHTMHIAKRSSNCKSCIWDGTELFIRVPHLFRLSVQERGITISVVYAIFFTSSDAQLHLEQAVDLGHSLEILLALAHVFLQGLLREIDHMRGEERLAILFEVSFISIQHPIHPRQACLVTMICVENDRDTVQLCNFAHMLGTGNGTRNACLVVLVVSRLASDELSTSHGEGDHDRTTILGSCLHASID
mmetsp:Transcript_39229/g.72850  ORF Transcript_39229/g.72850 Transcript_39229/m.72850 type:complete len:225 (+) Transcript_39229:379-1053(+)